MAEKNKQQPKQPKAPTPVPIERRHVQYANSVEINANPAETYILFQINGPENKGLSGTQVIMPTEIVKSLALMLWMSVLQAEKSSGKHFEVPSGLASAIEELEKALHQG